MAMLRSWVERTVMQNSAIRNSCWKIFIQWSYHNSLNWRKDIYSAHTENLKNHQLCATAATKKKDVATKCLRKRSAFRQSLMASVGESQVVEKTQVWYYCLSRSQGKFQDCNCNVMLLLPAIGLLLWISHEFSVCQQDSVQRIWCMRQSTFLPITSPDIDWF